jgi:hypothetical protein
MYDAYQQSGGDYQRSSIHERRTDASPAYAGRMPRRMEGSEWSPQRHRRASRRGGACGCCSALLCTFATYSAITGLVVTLLSVASPEMGWREMRAHAAEGFHGVAAQDWDKASLSVGAVADEFLDGIGRADWSRLGNVSAVVDGAFSSFSPAASAAAASSSSSASAAAASATAAAWTASLSERLQPPLDAGLDAADGWIGRSAEALRAQKDALGPELEPLIEKAADSLATPLGRLLFGAGVLAYVVVLPALLRSFFSMFDAKRGGGGAVGQVWGLLRDSVLVVLLLCFAAAVVQWIVSVAKKMDSPDYAATTDGDDHDGHYAGGSTMEEAEADDGVAAIDEPYVDEMMVVADDDGDDDELMEALVNGEAAF